MEEIKVISQETFDDVILENIVEFGSSLEEAINETIIEFQTQGVVLGNIVKNPRLSDDEKELIHDVLYALNVLKSKNFCNQSDTEEICKALKTIISECKISIAHRVLACKHDAYQILLKGLENMKDDGNNNLQLSLTLQAMAGVTDTNPDILNAEGVQLLIEMLQIWKNRTDDEEVCCSLVRWCLECCLKHEKNRQILVAAGVPGHLKDVLINNNSNKMITKGCFKTLKAVTLDDDIRTEFGKSHDHARLLVEEHGMIKICLEQIKVFLADCDVTSEILSTLSRMCVRTEYCQQAVDNGALDVINDILLNFPDNAQLNRQSFNLLKTISGNDKVKEQVMKIGAAQLIVGALIKHQSLAPLCESALAAISMLALRVPAHANQLVKLGAADAVVHVMKIHSDNKQIQKLGCMAVRNLACTVTENKNALIECQVEGVLNSVLDKFGSDYYMKDLAKAALRDLDLEVKLEEQWKGTGVQMAQ